LAQEVILLHIHPRFRASLLSISFFPHRIHEHCWQIDQKVCRCFCGSGCPCTDSISVGVRKFFNSSIIEKHLCCSISPPTDDEDDLLAEGPPSSDPPTDYEVDLSAEETDRGRPETYEERWPEQARWAHIAACVSYYLISFAGTLGAKPSSPNRHFKLPLVNQTLKEISLETTRMTIDANKWNAIKDELSVRGEILYTTATYIQMPWNYLPVRDNRAFEVVNVEPITSPCRRRPEKGKRGVSCFCQRCFWQRPRRADWTLGDHRSGWQWPISSRNHPICLPLFSSFRWRS